MCSCAVVSPDPAKSLPVRHINQARPSMAVAHKACTIARCARRKPGLRKPSSESKTTCSPLSDTSGSAAKMTITISSSVISRDPGIELESSLRPPTSKKVSAMMANSAMAATTPQAASMFFFNSGNSQNERRYPLPKAGTAWSRCSRPKRLITSAGWRFPHGTRSERWRRSSNPWHLPLLPSRVQAC